MKIKLLRVYLEKDEDGYNSYRDSLISSINHVTDWTDVSDEDGELLKNNLRFLPYKPNTHYIVLEQQEDETTLSSIEEIKRAIEKEQKRREKERKEREELAKKRAKTREENKKKKTLEELEKLAKSLGKKVL